MFSTALTAPGRTRLDFNATRIAIVPPSASQFPQSAADSGNILQERPCRKVLHCSHRPTQEPDCQELCKQIHSLQSIFPTVLSHLGAESHISMHMCEWRHERDGGRAASVFNSNARGRRAEDFTVCMIAASFCTGLFQIYSPLMQWKVNALFLNWG